MAFSTLSEGVQQVRRCRNRLVLVYGTAALDFIHASEGGTCPVFNLNLELADGLLAVAPQGRAAAVHVLFARLVGGYGSDVLLLSRPEILFEPVLSVDPIRLILNNAKNTTIVLQWPGKVTATSLSYATPGHPEYRSWRLSELGETILINADEY